MTKSSELKMSCGALPGPGSGFDRSPGYNLDAIRNIVTSGLACDL